MTAQPAADAVLLNAELERLMPFERTALALIYGRHLSQDEVAEHMSLSQPTVRKIVSRALIKLGDALIGHDTTVHLS